MARTKDAAETAPAWGGFEAQARVDAPRNVIGRLGREPAALSLRAHGDGVRIEFLDRDGERLLALGPYEYPEAVAVGRAIADETCIPIFGCEAATEGPAVFPWESARRRLAVLNGRRPRFLVRRKPGHWPRRPLVYREPEMFGGLDR